MKKEVFSRDPKVNLITIEEFYEDTFILFHLIGLVFLGLGFIRTKMGWKKYANTEQNLDAIALDEKKKQLKKTLVILELNIQQIENLKIFLN